jgi:hypothetical protein
MLNIHTQRKVQFATVDRGTALVVVAFLVETVGNETRVISGPKIVKIILKKNLELSGSVKSQTVLALPASISNKLVSEKLFVSPYFAQLFGKNSEFVVSLAARPPTYA